jgi:hypothetical protein
MIQRYKTILSPKNTILLPANNNYPDSLVSMSIDIQSRSKESLESSMQNRGETSLSPKRFQEFLALVCTDEVYDGKGTKLVRGIDVDPRLSILRKSLFGHLNTPIEVLDGKFELKEDGKIYFTYHKYDDAGNLELVKEELTPSINCFVYKNPQGFEPLNSTEDHVDFQGFANLNNQGYLSTTDLNLMNVLNSDIRDIGKIPTNIDPYRGVQIFVPTKGDFQGLETLYAYYRNNPNAGRGTIGFYNGKPRLKIGVRPTIAKSDLDRIIASDSE